MPKLPVITRIENHVFFTLFGREVMITWENTMHMPSVLITQRRDVLLWCGKLHIAV